MPYVQAARALAARVAGRAARSLATRAARGIGVRSAYRTGAFRKTSNRKFRRAVDKAVNRNKETCHLDFSYGKTELYHNTFNNFTNNFGLLSNPTLPTQGDGDSQRTGNVVNYLSMQIRAMILLKGDRVNTKVRFMVLSFPKGASTATISTFMDAVTGNLIIDPIDKGRCRKHIDTTIGYKDLNPGGGVAAKEVTIFRTFNIKLNKRVTFYDDGAQDNNFTRDYYAFAFAYDTFGTLITDNIAAIQLWRRLSWKDI